MNNTPTPLIGDYLYGYIEGEERQLILNTTEQIVAFIMANHTKSVKIVNFLDTLEIETAIMGGYIVYCNNQKYQPELIQVLSPIQQGEVEAPKYVPYSNEKFIVRNARFKTKKGTYCVVDVNFIDGINITTTSEEFISEEALLEKYPDTINEDEARYIMGCTYYTRTEFIEEYLDSYADIEDLKELLQISDERINKLWNEEEIDSLQEEVEAAFAKLSNEELYQFTRKHNMYILLED